METPAFCPNPKCRYHFGLDHKTKFYNKSGTYLTAAFGQVQRYKCIFCGKGFSEQTFSLDYYNKKVISYRQILKHIYTTSSVRDICREFGISVDSVNNRIARMARQAIGCFFYVGTMEFGLREALVADGFESFCVSQYFPNNINLLLGKNSQFIYFTNYVTIRRKGRMNEKQKAKRAELEKVFLADPAGIYKSFRDLLYFSVELFNNIKTWGIKLFTDKKKEYARAFRDDDAVFWLHKDGLYDHFRISSREPRTLSNHLFSANYLDRQIRKDLSDHVRETVCFARNVMNMMDLLLYIFSIITI